MNNSKKLCIAISVICLVVLGILFFSWRNRSIKEAEMTASERQKNNAEVSSIYKRKVEEAKTATELPSSETTETTEGSDQKDKEKQAGTPDLDEDGSKPAGAADGSGTAATDAAIGTEDAGSSKTLEDGQAVQSS